MGYQMFPSQIHNLMHTGKYTGTTPREQHPEQELHAFPHEHPPKTSIDLSVKVAQTFNFSVNETTWKFSFKTRFHSARFFQDLPKLLCWFLMPRDLVASWVEVTSWRALGHAYLSTKLPWAHSVFICFRPCSPPSQYLQVHSQWVCGQVVFRVLFP